MIDTASQQLNYRSFAYRGEADYWLVRRLLVDVFAASGHPSHCTIGDLDWWRSQEPSPEMGLKTAQLWATPTGELVGFAWPDKNQADMIVHPDHKHLENEILEWAEYRWLQSATDDGADCFSCQAFETDSARTSLLANRGYQRGEALYIYRVRPLATPIPDMPVPSAFVIRNLNGEHEAPGRAAAHRRAFAPSQMTDERYLWVMRSPTYRLDLDIVVQDTGGQILAFCLIWYDEENQMGVFEPVGCHPDYRRKGCARAVMIEGLRRLFAMGANQAVVGSQCVNGVANHLYESLGFIDPRRTHQWFKPRSAICDG